MDSINSRIAEELGVRPQQVEAAVALLDEGSTVPFISRYRKEVTGAWMTPSYVIWKNACATCENSMNGVSAFLPASKNKAS